MSIARSWLVLTDGYLDSRNAKTAHGVLRYARDPVAGVLDREHAGRTVRQIVPDLASDAPIVASVREGIDRGATSLLVGVATPGGWMPEDWRGWIIEALENGLEVANGLHRFLRDDPEFVAAAERGGGRLWDVREPPANIPLCEGKAADAPQRIVGTVGTDCAVGKMTASLELVEAAHRTGINAEFVATGQTGIVIAGRGIAVDRVISDFVSGAAEQLVLESDPSSEVLMIEGQGGLWHPAYSGVTLGLLHGSAPESLVLVHKAGHEAIEEPPYTKLPPIDYMIRTYEEIASVVRPCVVSAIAVNTHGLDDNAARHTVEELEDQTGLPTGDTLRGDAPKLWAAVARSLGL